MSINAIVLLYPLGSQRFGSLILYILKEKEERLNLYNFGGDNEVVWTSIFRNIKDWHCVMIYVLGSCGRVVMAGQEGLCCGCGRSDGNLGLLRSASISFASDFMLRLHVGYCPPLPLVQCSYIYLQVSFTNSNLSPNIYFLSIQSLRFRLVTIFF